jgi:hypothetical protein
VFSVTKDGVRRHGEAAGNGVELLAAQQEAVHGVAAMVVADCAGAGQRESPGRGSHAPRGHAREEPREKAKE